MVSEIITSTMNVTNNPMACHTPVTIDCESDPSHFALISIDIEGGLHLRCSRSIAKTFQGSLSVRLADTFLKAVKMSGEACSAIDQGAFYINSIVEYDLITNCGSITSANHASH